MVPRSVPALMLHSSQPGRLQRLRWDLASQDRVLDVLNLVHAYSIKEHQAYAMVSWYVVTIHQSGSYVTDTNSFHNAASRVSVQMRGRVPLSSSYMRCTLKGRQCLKIAQLPKRGVSAASAS